MLVTLLTTTALLLLSPRAPRTSACPPPLPYPNTTLPVNATLPTPEPATIPISVCQYVYPSTIYELNSLYPTNASDPTHFFQVIHQVNQTSSFRLQVAAQVQFVNIPAIGLTPCRLELVLPNSKLSRLAGPAPLFNIFAVERAPGTEATWETFEARESVAKANIVGAVNGSQDSLEQSRAENGGVLKITERECNETLTFQMAMVEPKTAPWINYWDWVEVSPPAAPAQGFRVVFGC
ncbi:hypothetical protein B0J11DRAFT_122319 [Dendryphion nanum]|uniref:Ubiquitin 3 binding protein But2 C-terminal domain-containing protein n=1 Tax=Dendryphion nanum TaxID=256645 RepID=A0A9P9D7C1_9PLEO|nr:hypothetical protein B0J11DRAFT_122319 [Dendryphion nanum]